MKPFNKKGSVLPMTVMLISVISILGAALLSVSLVNQKMAIQENDSEQAYLSAKSVSQYIEQNITALYKSGEGVKLTIPNGSSSGVLGDVVVSSNVPTEVDGSLLNVSVEATYEGKKAIVNSVYKLNVIPKFTSMITIGSELILGTGTYPGAGYTSYDENTFGNLTEQELKETIQSAERESDKLVPKGFDPLFDGVDINLEFPKMGNECTTSPIPTDTDSIAIKSINLNLKVDNECFINSTTFTESKNNRLIMVQAKESGSNITINAEAKNLDNSNEKSFIGVVLPDNATSGKYILNIYVKPTNGGMYLYLPTIRYYKKVGQNLVRTPRPSGVNEPELEVNVYNDTPGFTLNVHQNNEQGGKQDGVIDANIVIPKGNLLLTTEDSKQVDLAEGIIIGTVVCDNLIVNTQSRSDKPYLIDQTGWVKPDLQRKEVKLFFDRYQK